MNIVSVFIRHCRVAISLALISTNSITIVVFARSNPSAVARAAQKPSSANSNNRHANTDDTGFTRARRAEPKSGDIQNATPSGGPIIRVALMTDVSSVALSCASGLNVRKDAKGFDDAGVVPSGSVNVELRQVPESVKPGSKIAASFRVALGASTESRGTRKLLDELRKKFFEPAEMTFDEKQREYSVLIGQFGTRVEAAKFLERLRNSGYEDLRIVSDQRPTGNQSADSTDTNSRAAKYKAQTTSTSRSLDSSERRSTQLVALASDRVAVTSNVELVISAVGSQSDRNRTSTDSSENDRYRQQINGRSPIGAGEPDSKTAPAPVVRIGKTDYRGEIKLVLNPRGRINVVNALPLEDYLRGVVPMEMSPGAFPEIEALKAQAIAARSYALARLGQHRDQGFDLVDDTRAQVYGGFSAERELTNRAIAETRGVAVVFNDNGKPAPIEALYTANCGGRTENNEEVFGGRPTPYLRAVSCSPDRHTFTGRDILSGRTRDPLIGTDGRSIAREVGLLTILGFPIPRRPTNTYLSRSPDEDELRNWLEQTARLTQRGKLNIARGDRTRLAEFIGLVAVSLYGEGRANTLLAPADVDYLLDGLRVQTFPREARADAAMLLRDGILRLPADATLDGRASITRAYAIETLARAITAHQPAGSRTQTTDSKSQIQTGAQVATLASEIAMPADGGRLMIASAGSTGDSLAREKARYTSVNASAPGKIVNQRQDEPAKTKQSSAGRNVENSVSVRDRRDEPRNAFEISDEAWLFRNIAGESHQVERLNLIGGERVTYHLNAKGQVDFLEASISGRSASSDRYSSVAQWQERITADDLQQRLARVRVNVGQLLRIDPIAFSSSSRVTEVEVTGSEGSARLRRSQIRPALGLKEYLFVVDPETDARGQIVAFVFTGRGWGHGVGMCQTGAYGLARDGYSHAAILKKYYSGVDLLKMY